MAKQRQSAILHIGTEKTGTTTIQNLLASKRKELTALGCWYPSSPGHVCHTALAAFAAPENMVDVWDGRFDEAEFARRLAEEMAALPSQIGKVIFSCEFLHSRLTNTEHIRKLQSLFASHFATFTVIVYLRRQDDMACSAYSTLLRSGDWGFDVLPSVPESSQSIDSHRDFLWSHYFDFERLLDRYSAVFGKHSIMPRLFEPNLLKGGNVVPDFLITCGLPPWLGDGARRENRALPADGQEFLASLNAFSNPARGLNSGISEETRDICASIVEARLDGPPRLPSRADARRFYAQFRDVNERIRAAWFPERPALFSEDFSRYPESPGDAESSRPERALRAAFVIIEDLAQKKRTTEDALRAQVEASQEYLARAQVAQAESLAASVLAAAAQTEIARLTDALATANQEAAAARTEAMQAAAVVDGLRSSASWRLTAPLRATVELLRGYSAQDHAGA